MCFQILVHIHFDSNIIINITIINSIFLNDTMNLGLMNDVDGGADMNKGEHSCVYDHG